jgi:hypothetical protein
MSGLLSFGALPGFGGLGGPGRASIETTDHRETFVTYCTYGGCLNKQLRTTHVTGHGERTRPHPAHGEEGKKNVEAYQHPEGSSPLAESGQNRIKKVNLE